MTSRVLLFAACCSVLLLIATASAKRADEEYVIKADELQKFLDHEGLLT